MTDAYNSLRLQRADQQKISFGNDKAHMCIPGTLGSSAVLSRWVGGKQWDGQVFRKACSDGRLAAAAVSHPCRTEAGAAAVSQEVGEAFYWES